MTTQQFKKSTGEEFNVLSFAFMSIQSPLRRSNWVRCEAPKGVTSKFTEMYKDTLGLFDGHSTFYRTYECRTKFVTLYRKDERHDILYRCLTCERIGDSDLPEADLGIYIAERAAALMRQSSE